MSHWFNTESWRDLSVRYRGLDFLEQKIKNPKILDLGGAEGSISAKIDSNAKIDCVDSVSIPIQDRYANITYYETNLNSLEVFEKLKESYDIVLLLAILQKLNDPVKLLRKACEVADTYIAIRVPEYFLSEEIPGFSPVHVVPGDKELFLGDLTIYERNK